MPKDLSADKRPSREFGRMWPREPDDVTPRGPAPGGNRNALCGTCGAEIGRVCRCRKNGRFMAGVHESRQKRTERTGAVYLTRDEMKRLGKIK